MVTCQRPKKTHDTHELFTKTIKLSISSPRISKITGPIFTKFTYFMFYIYTTLYTKFQRNWIGSSRDMCSWKSSNFLLFLLFPLCTRILLKHIKTTILCFNFCTPIEVIRAYVFTKFGAILSKFEWVTHNNIAKIVHNLLSHLLYKPLKLWPWNLFQMLIYY